MHPNTARLIDLIDDYNYSLQNEGWHGNGKNTKLARRRLGVALESLFTAHQIDLAVAKVDVAGYPPIYKDEPIWPWIVLPIALPLAMVALAWLAA